MAMKGCVDITGLGYPEVLLALYKGANPVSGKKKTGLKAEEAKDIFSFGPGHVAFIGELKGAFIGVTFSGEVLDVQFYDGHNGEGTAQAVIDELRREKAAEGLTMLKLMPEVPATAVTGAAGRAQRLFGTAASITPAMLRAAQGRGN